MACFKLIYQNHWNFGIHVADTILMIKYALENEGHRADIEKAIVPGAINIVLENFDQKFLDDVNAATAHNNDTSFIIVATEFLTGDSFNNFTQSSPASSSSSLSSYQSNSLSHYEKNDYWQERYQSFLQMLPFTKAIWHLSEAQVEVYREGLDFDAVYYLPHVYAKEMRSVNHRPDEDKDIDFLFTGTLTDYRKTILNSLEDKGYKVACLPMLTAPFHRNDVIGRSKVALNIRQHAQWQHPSNSRFYYHLMNQSLMVTEHSQYQCDLNPYVLTAPPDSLVEFAEEVLRAGEYTKRATECLRRFSGNVDMSEKFKSAVNSAALN